MKKGEGLSLSTIIIAIIVLIVLVVMIMLISGKMGSFRTSVNDCASIGGVCETENTIIADDSGSACGLDLYGQPRKELIDGECANEQEESCCSPK